jgi:alkylhydroperoxidase family enzyme
VHGAAGDPCWDPEQAAVFRVNDELHETGTLSDELWSELAARFDEPQLLELIVTAGWYQLIGFVCNAAGIELEEWAARLPER